MESNAPNYMLVHSYDSFSFKFTFILFHEYYLSHINTRNVGTDGAVRMNIMKMKFYGNNSSRLLSLID